MMTAKFLFRKANGRRIDILTFLLLAFMTISCKECDDDCMNTYCVNGFCEDGTCQCEEGYTGDHCDQVVDPCMEISCQNNGACVNGQCDCPTGFMGEYCEIMLQPTGLVIWKIELKEWWELNYNINPPARWDASADSSVEPDLFFRCYSNNVLIGETETIWHSLANTDYEFTAYDLPVKFTGLQITNRITLFDDDSNKYPYNDDDPMATYRFAIKDLFNSEKGFPEKITIGRPDTSNSKSSLHATLYVEWIF